MLMGAASQFFCDPDGTLGSQDPMESADAYTECVYRDDTLVLLELTTRDMMEVCSWFSFMDTQSHDWMKFAHIAHAPPKLHD